MSRDRRSTSGAAFVEFTAVFPVILLLTLGGIDFTILMIKWVSLHRATDVGVRLASLTDPVAIGINAATPATGGAAPGTACYDFSTHQTTNKCATKPSTICTGGVTNGKCCPVGSNAASCTPNYQWNESTFQKVIAEMNRQMLTEALDRRQVQIAYEPTGYGYAMRPVGSPMNITVSVRCTTYPFYLLYPLMGWAFPAKSADCAGIPGSGMSLPNFPSTLPAEDLSTAN